MGEERDWSVWLDERLSNPWSADRASQSLSQECLTQVLSKWSVMEAGVKLRVLLSIAGAPKRAPNFPSTAKAFQDLVSQAKEDSDEWVAVVAELVERFVDTGKIGVWPNSERLQAGLQTLRSLAGNGALQTALSGMMPREVPYLADGATANPPARDGPFPEPAASAAHCSFRSGWNLEDYGLSSIKPSKPDLSVDTPSAPVTWERRLSSTSGAAFPKPITPRHRQHTLSADVSWAGSQADAQRSERRIVVEEADEDSEPEEQLPKKRGRASALLPRRKPDANPDKDDAEHRPKKGRGAAHADHDKAAVEDHEDHGPGFVPAEPGVDGGGGKEEAEDARAKDMFPAGEAAGVQSGPSGQEIIAEWKRQLKTIAGLMEIVNTSRHLMEAERQAVVDFIQGQKRNPFPDQQAQRNLTLREERVDGKVESIVLQINYASGAWKVSRHTSKA